MNEKSLCIGEPLPNFFQCVDLVIFQACASCIGEPFSIQICVSVWLGIVQAFNREVADDITHLELSFLVETTNNVFYSILMYFEHIFPAIPRED